MGKKGLSLVYRVPGGMVRAQVADWTTFKNEHPEFTSLYHKLFQSIAELVRDWDALKLLGGLSERTVTLKYLAQNRVEVPPSKFLHPTFRGVHRRARLLCC